MAESDWRDVVKWAAKMAEVVDFDKEERNYKIALAQKLKDVRALMEASSPDWETPLLRALQVNLIHYTSVTRFRAVMEANPDEVRAEILKLWTTADKTAAVRRFYDYLSGKDPKIYIGASLALASILLLADDSGEYAPYKTEAVRKVIQLAGEQAPDDYSVEDRWDRFLGLLDSLRERAAGVGLELRDRLDAQGVMWSLAKLPPETFPELAEAKEFQAWRTGGAAAGSGATSGGIERRNSDRPAVENAGWALLEAGLTGKPSLFDGKTIVWTAENALNLAGRFGDEIGTSDGTFVEKLEKQLDGAPLAVYLLAAELMYLDLVPVSNVLEGTKVERIQAILTWSGSGISIPAPLKKGLAAGGAFNGGLGYNTQRWRHVLWLCAFIEKWSVLSEAARKRALGDPWAFFRALQGVAPDSPAMRSVLTYFAWPNVFPHIVSPDHRKRIRDAFAGEIGGATGKDDEAIARDIYEIRTVLEERAGGPFDFYVTPYEERWLGDKTRRAWFVSSQQGGGRGWEAWTRADVVSLGTPDANKLTAGMAEEDVAQLVDLTHPDEDADQRLRRTRELHAFVTRMKSGDLVVTVADGELHGGEVSGPLSENPTSEPWVEKSVSWFDTALPVEGLPPQVSSALAAPGRLVELSSLVDVLDEAFAERGGPNGHEEVEQRFRLVTPEFAASLHMDAAEVERFVRALEDRKQLVFYGPPGTGKTFLARQIARHLAGADRPQAVTLVQFHPSYAYEDFFEGFRPSLEKNQATFVLTKGPLARIAEEARRPENRGLPYFLIIDEMNRGNLAKVFGELYFLLEYRDEAVSLQYSPSVRFALPPNLYIIGTMNTTDRSVGLIDAAIRRRFPFIELHPDSSPVEGVLEAFLASHGWGSERADLLRAINRSIDARDLRIGPSYFMRSGAETEDGLRQIWDYDILPLLAEHFYPRKDAAAIASEFGLDAMRRSLVTVVEVPAADSGDEA